MKPIYLEFCGINSFSEKTQIDFRALLSGGVFGIFGNTGSGKSTILDCIHLALYGVIERAGRSVDYINYREEEAYVVFDFELTTEGVRRAYRVRRERKRKNASSKASLWEYTAENKLLAIAEGARDVDAAIEKIVGLEFNDFKMCIALPQGDFAALVKAQTSERVKLVSRLFDLEKYGERLSKAANEKYYAAEHAVELIKAQMDQNAEASDEMIASKISELQTAQTELEVIEKELKAVESEYERLSALKKEKEAHESDLKKLQQLQTRLLEMSQKRDEIKRLASAQALIEKADAIENNQRAKKNAQGDAVRAHEAWLTEKARAEAAQKNFDEQKFEEKLVEYATKLDKVRGATADIMAANNAQKAFDECAQKYREISKNCVEEDFAAKLESIDKQLDALGEDDTLLDYLKRNFKDVLLAETYGEVRQDLRAIKEKYPVAATDIDALIKKYTFATVGDERSLDVAQVNLAFKQLEAEKKRLRKERTEIENRERTYKDNVSKRDLLKEEGKVHRAALVAAQEKIAFLADVGSEQELEEGQKRCKDAQKSAQEKIEAAKERAQKCLVDEEKNKAIVAQCESAEQTLNEAFEKAQQKSGFDRVDEARALIARLGDEERAQKECDEFFKEYELYKSRCEQADKRRLDEYQDELFAATRVIRADKSKAKDEKTAHIATLKSELSYLEKMREKYREYEAALKEKQKWKDLCDEFRSLLKSNKFLEFIATEYLQEICVSASDTLLSLTGGKYFLRYDKEFKVGDNLDGGNLRAVKTLSGGETFLVSLSLALSLSGAICQKSLRPIEFFFLDEGFGTLDEQLLDTVMNVLGKLSKNFAVGLISHVEELKHRIDNKILVTGATETHGSTIRITNL
ncbi:MAG: SMC family ATPase [Clostridia bacterium]|nr:SMC family ATPase [Clostridia bacterium]